MRSHLRRGALALFILLFCQFLVLSVPQPALAEDDDDSSSSHDDDDDSAADEVFDLSEVPYDNVELGGGCACGVQGSPSVGGAGLLAAFAFSGLLRRRRIQAR